MRSHESAHYMNLLLWHCFFKNMVQISLNAFYSMRSSKHVKPQSNMSRRMYGLDMSHLTLLTYHIFKLRKGAYVSDLERTSKTSMAGRLKPLVSGCQNLKI